jgi:hypothetical protein
MAEDLIMTKADEKILECAKTLKRYCAEFGRGCKGCLFDTDDECVLSSLPEDWNVECPSKTKAVELLKEMRHNALNATQYDDEKREAKAEALKMAIEALGGKDDGR